MISCPSDSPNRIYPLFIEFTFKYLECKQSFTIFFFHFRNRPIYQQTFMVSVRCNQSINIVIDIGTTQTDLHSLNSDFHMDCFQNHFDGYYI